MKKVFFIFTMLMFLFSSVFLASPKSVSADPGMFAEMVRDQASDACINNIARASLPLTQELDIYNYEMSEEEEDTFTIIEDEGTYTRTVETNDSIMPYAVSAFKNEVATSSQGSKIILPLGQFTPAYGYCHTFKGHMLNSDGTKKHSVKIGGEPKSQFQYPRYPETTMDIIVEVVNGTTDLKCQKERPTRCTKEANSKLEGQKVKVVLERGKSYSGYSNYNWVVITAYPKW